MPTAVEPTPGTPPGGEPQRRRPAIAPARSLAFKLALFILTSTTCIFILAFASSYRSSKDLLLKNVRENARNLLQAAAARIEIHLAAVEQIPRYLARGLGEQTPSQEVLERRLHDMTSRYCSTAASRAAWRADVSQGLVRNRKMLPSLTAAMAAVKSANPVSMITSSCASTGRANPPPAHDTPAEALAV